MSLDVLIADQDVKLAELYGRFLDDHGFSTSVAAGGLECLRKLRQQRPRVLVLDSELPWGDTCGVLACLREDGWSQPVILTTWDASPQSVRRFVVPPVVLCLHKFFPLPTLLAAVHSAVDTDRGWDARLTASRLACNHPEVCHESEKLLGALS